MDGALIAAIEVPGGRRVRALASDSGRASMAPDGKSCIMRPRAATSFSASSSENTPAKQAATYSPMLCPIIACGRTPQLIHSFARAYSMMNSAGCVWQVSLSC